MAITVTGGYQGGVGTSPSPRDCVDGMPAGKKLIEDVA
jgi:hypothetical protein